MLKRLVWFFFETSLRILSLSLVVFFVDVRMCCMKMLYSKPTWSTASISELMAPSGRMQLKGSKVVFSMPFQSVSSSLAATNPSVAPTLGTLAQHMLDMDSKAFEDGGGCCVYMIPGDFLWIRECCITAEFNVGQPKSDDIHTCLRWVALTSYHCSDASCRETLAYVKSALSTCCEPSQKAVEKQLQAWLIPNWGWMITKS